LARAGLLLSIVTDPSDDTLVALCKSGDGSAAELLVRRHARPIGAYLARFTGSIHDGEDLLQETFARFFAGLDTYRPEGKFKAYLYRIATNLALKRRRREVLAPLPDTAIDPTPGPDAVASTRQLARDVQNGIRELSEEQRQALLLKTYHGLSYEEIAHIQEASVAAVKVRVFRAREILRGLLGSGT
jgi:RNA polymerase sigma-70 factor (ECF subfamily)